MMKLANLFLTLSIIAGQAGNCQQRFNWEKYHQLFRKDSVESFQNTLSGFEKLASIKQSGNQIELRFLVGHPRGTNASLYQFTYNNGDSMFFAMYAQLCMSFTDQKNLIDSINNQNWFLYDCNSSPAGLKYATLSEGLSDYFSAYNKHRL